jgi:hypothetical protein
MAMINIASITKDTAIQRAKNYRGAKEGLQIAITWAVGQALQGNADGVHQVFVAAGLMANEEGVMTTYVDGRAVFAYMTAKQDQGGCGLSGIIKWDKEANKFKMAEKWKGKAASIDMVKLVETLSYTRWDTFKKSPASKAFDLDKAIATLITRAANEGVSDQELKAKFRELAAA